ncbi:unnamed protein product [Victoria cruziana]
MSSYAPLATGSEGNSRELVVPKRSKLHRARTARLTLERVVEAKAITNYKLPHHGHDPKKHQARSSFSAFNRRNRIE